MMEKMVSSLQRRRGTKPNTPTKKTEHETIIRKRATFSRHACLASLVGRITHMLGIAKVMIQAKDAHSRPSTAFPPSFSWRGWRTALEEERERPFDSMVCMVDWVPTDSEAQLNFAWGMIALLLAREREDAREAPP